MLSVKKLRRQPRHFMHFTGLSVAQFDLLLAELEPVYQERHAQRLRRADRQRELGAGHPFHLPLADRLLATLLALRLNLTGPLLGYLFNLDQSTLWRERHRRMLPVLLEVLPIPLQDHVLSAVDPEEHPRPGDTGQSPGQPNQPGSSGKPRRKRISTLQELLQAHPEFAEVWLDATEQEVPKPKDKSPRKHRFSGKHKCHTLKTQVVTARTLEQRNVIVHAFGGLPGSLHDHLLLRASGVLRQVPQRCTVRLDRGYEGVEREYPSTRIVKAKRARRKHPLNVVERCYNRVINALRMPVEHSLGQLKKFAVLAGIYRGSARGYNAVFRCVAGLHNFRSLGRLSWAA